MRRFAAREAARAAREREAVVQPHVALKDKTRHKKCQHAAGGKQVQSHQRGCARLTAVYLRVEQRPHVVVLVPALARAALSRRRAYRGVSTAGPAAGCGQHCRACRGMRPAPLEQEPRGHRAGRLDHLRASAGHG